MAAGNLKCFLLFLIIASSLTTNFVSGEQNEGSPISRFLGNFFQGLSQIVEPKDPNEDTEAPKSKTGFPKKTPKTATNSNLEDDLQVAIQKFIPLATATENGMERIYNDVKAELSSSPKGIQRILRIILGLMFLSSGLRDSGANSSWAEKWLPLLLLAIRPLGDTIPNQVAPQQSPAVSRPLAPPRLPPMPKKPSENMAPQNIVNESDELLPEPEEDIHMIGGLDIEPGITKEQMKKFNDEVLPNILPDSVTGELRERMGKILAMITPKIVDFVDNLETLPKAMQKALQLPLQYLPGNKRYSSVNQGNRKGIIIDLSRPRRELSAATYEQRSLGKRETEQQKMNRLLGTNEGEKADQSDYSNTRSSAIITWLQNAAKNILPYQKFLLLIPKFWLNIFAIPFAIYFALPSIRMESAEWYINPFPIRIVQAIFPLFSRGDWNVLLFLRSMIPLPLRLLYATIPHASGPYRFPKAFVGILPSKALPHRRIRLPDGDYKRISEVIPYLLQIPKAELPGYIHKNILDRLPPKLRELQYNLGIPTIIKKPWQILGIFPRYFPFGPENNAIKVALLLMRIGAPLVFLTFFLNAFNVPGAILLGIVFTIPAMFVFNPLRWFNPIIVGKLLLGIKPKLPIF